MKRRKRAVVTTLLFSILLTVIPVGDNGQSMMQQCAAADTVTGQKSVSACEYLNDTTALAASVITISNADDLRAFKKILQKRSMKGKTVVQTEDIALSKYTYRYDDSSLYYHRIGIYDGDTLRVYGRCRGQGTSTAKSRPYYFLGSVRRDRRFCMDE